MVIGDIPLIVHANILESPSRGVCDGDIDNMGFSRANNTITCSKNQLSFYIREDCRYTTRKAINVTEVNKV